MSIESREKKRYINKKGQLFKRDSSLRGKPTTSKIRTNFDNFFSVENTF